MDRFDFFNNDGQIPATQTLTVDDIDDIMAMMDESEQKLANMMYDARKQLRDIADRRAQLKILREEMVAPSPSPNTQHIEKIVDDRSLYIPVRGLNGEVVSHIKVAQEDSDMEVLHQPESPAGIFNPVIHWHDGPRKRVPVSSGGHKH
jgi:hypothetical protein